MTAYNLPPGVSLQDIEDQSGPHIADEDVQLDHIPNVRECRALRRRFAARKFYPNVWHINERGNVDLLVIGYNGAKIVQSWV